MYIYRCIWCCLILESCQLIKIQDTWGSFSLKNINKTLQSWLKTLNYHEYNQFISIAIAFFFKFIYLFLLDMWFPILFYFTEKKDKFSLLSYQTCLYFLIICSKNNKLLHINTPWIIQYCFICSCPCSTNLVQLVQATICKYYMCKVWKLSNK